MSNTAILTEKETALEQSMERAKGALEVMFPAIEINEFFDLASLNSGLTGFVYTVTLTNNLTVDGQPYSKGTQWVLKIPVLTENPLGNKQALTHEIAAYKFLDSSGITPKLISSIEEVGLLIEKVANGIESKALGLEQSLKSGSLNEFLYKIQQLISVYKTMKKQGIIHLDLSSSNILWESDHYKLIDWAFHTAPTVPTTEENPFLILASPIEHTSAFFFLGCYAYGNSKLKLVSLQSLLGDNVLYDDYIIPVNTARENRQLTDQELRINHIMANNYNVVMLVLMIFGILFKPNPEPIDIKMVEDDDDDIPSKSFVNFIKTLELRFTNQKLTETQIGEIKKFFHNLIRHFLLTYNTTTSVKKALDENKDPELGLSTTINQLFTILGLPLSLP